LGLVVSTKDDSFRITGGMVVSQVVPNLGYNRIQKRSLLHYGAKIVTKSWELYTCVSLKKFHRQTIADHYEIAALAKSLTLTIKFFVFTARSPERVV